MAFSVDSVGAQVSCCFHCGDSTGEGVVLYEGKRFCCTGCRLVYEVLAENNLCRYYSFQKTPGRTPSFDGDARYQYLDDPAIAQQLMDFSEGPVQSATLFIPRMHCSSCVWLLENLHRLSAGILQSRVDFLRKTIHIRFSRATGLRTVVELLASLGYEPELTLASVQPAKSSTVDRSLYSKIGIAGFCFGNIMILSLPEYLSGGTVDAELRRLFAYLNLLLGVPAFFYSGSDFFRSAIAGLRRRMANLDLPIALGISILFARSLYDILSHSGPGFLDSMTGLLFFLLVGRLFQRKTFDSLDFERNYTSYFPLAVTIRKRGEESVIPVAQLAPGDRMVIRNGGVIPADSILVRGTGEIDYSFVTGESVPLRRMPGDHVYAGGKQVGSAVELDVVKEVSQSYLTQLWNESREGRERRARLTALSNRVAQYFTAGVLALAAVTAMIWLPQDAATALKAVTGVLIVACPCALALSTPFTFGSAMRIFGRLGLYLKNAGIVESLANVDTIVLDKTGTITRSGESSVQFFGEELTQRERALVVSLARNTAHPLSRAVSEYCLADVQYDVAGFTEVPNEGAVGCVDGTPVRMGSKSFVLAGATAVERDHVVIEESHETRVYVSFDGALQGYFSIQNRYRDGLDKLVAGLRKRYHLFLLSGDTEGEKKHLQERFGRSVELHFNQRPGDKLSFVRSLQDRGATVLMVGDGLNDAGALRQSDVGIAVTDDTAAFSPSCDAILAGSALTRLGDVLSLSRTSVRIVLVSFALSFLYNIAGLTVAMQGELSPVIAAILMPLSSITVVLISTLWVRGVSRRGGLL